MEGALRLTQGFSTWPPALMRRLLARSRMGRFSRGELVGVERGAPRTFAIVSGYVVVGRTPPGGDRAPVTLIGPGNVVGIVWGVLDTHEPEDQVLYDFCAHMDTTVVEMPTLLIGQILDEEPALWKEMAKMLIKQHRPVLETLLSSGIGSLRQRLATTLEHLANLYGSREEKGLSLHLRLTQEDLATLLQVTRQSVNKELRALVACGALSLSYNTITVLDTEKLRAFSSKG